MLCAHENCECTSDEIAVEIVSNSKDVDFLAFPVALELGRQHLHQSSLEALVRACEACLRATKLWDALHRALAREFVG